MSMAEIYDKTTVINSMLYVDEKANTVTFNIYDILCTYTSNPQINFNYNILRQ